MAYLFVYTRLESFDYRLIYAPSDKHLPQPNRGEFIDFAREVINTDVFGDIKSPRHAIIKREQYTLIGLGCNSVELGVIQSLVETRAIRVFIGVYFDHSLSDAQIQSFTEIGFYKDLYSQYITPLWHTNKRNETKVNSIVQPVEILESVSLSRSAEIKVNSCANLCEIYPCRVNVFSLLKSCIQYKDIDAVTLLNSEDHIKEATLYKFHNATIIGFEDTRTLQLRKTCEDNQEVMTSKGDDSKRDMNSRKDSHRTRRTINIDNRPNEEHNTIDLRIGSKIIKLINSILHGLGFCAKDYEPRHIKRPKSQKTELGTTQSKFIKVEESPQLVLETKEERKKKIAALQASFKESVETTESAEINGFVSPNKHIENSEASEDSQDLTSINDLRSLKVSHKESSDSDIEEI